MGILNGFMISRVKMPALIATFATQIVVEGLAFLLTNGRPISGFLQLKLEESLKLYNDGAQKDGAKKEGSIKSFFKNIAAILKY